MANLEFKLELIRETINAKSLSVYKDEMTARKNKFDDLAREHAAFLKGISFVERLLYLLEPTEED